MGSAEPDGFDLAVFEQQLDEAEAWREAERTSARLEWPELRRAILARGGIGPSRDWERDRYPADLFRVDGLAPDIMAAELTLGRAGMPPWASVDDGNLTPSDGAMFDYLQQAYDAWREAPDRARRQHSYRRPSAADRGTYGNVARDHFEPVPVSPPAAGQVASGLELAAAPAAIAPSVAEGVAIATVAATVQPAHDLPAVWEPAQPRPATAPVAPVQVLPVRPRRPAVLRPALASLRGAARRSLAAARGLLPEVRHQAPEPARIIRLDPRARERRARRAFLAGLVGAYGLAGALIGCAAAVLVGGWTPPAALAPLALLPAASVPVAYVGRAALCRARSVRLVIVRRAA